MRVAGTLLGVAVVSRSMSVVRMKPVRVVVCVLLAAVCSSVWNSAARAATATSTKPPPKPATCAAGGPCKVGDRGPGGGTVFYVHPGGGTFSCGPTLTESCRYLEVAPKDHPSDAAWCSDSSTLLGAAGTAIGAGMANTATAVSACATGAIQIADAFVNNGRADWYLPSKDELNELCKFAQRRRTGNTAVVCDGTRRLRAGFAYDFYWSSTEDIETGAWAHGLPNGVRGSYAKSASDKVRPIRSF